MRQVTAHGFVNMRFVVLRSFLSLSCIVFLSALPSYAQESSQRMEIGAQAIVAGIQGPSGGGGGLSVDLNLSRILALQGRALWIADGAPTFSFHGDAGIRAIFLRSSTMSVYGAARPGWYHVPSTPQFAGDSHFVLGLDVGIAFPLVSKLAGRVELEREIHAVQEMRLPDDRLIGRDFVIPGRVQSRWNVNFVATYGVGSPVPHADPPAGSGRWSVGAQLGTTIAPSSAPVASGGGFVAYAIAPHIDLDGSVSVSFSAGLPAGLYEGGRLTQALAGVKIGVREGRWGVFLKLRAGINSWGDVVSTTTLHERSTTGALDLGGVIECAAGNTSFLRFDIGETLAFVSPALPALEGTTTPTLSGHWLYTLPMRVGFGVRF
jgi:hypothetical protein